MLRYVSEQRPKSITGIGIEPVEEHMQSLQHDAQQQAPGVALVCAAIGERDIQGVEVHALVHQNYNFLLRQVPPKQRDDFRQHLQYLQNMSCVGAAHPSLNKMQKSLHDQYNIWVNLDRVQTDMWTWAKLKQQLNFNGCELLIIDAEGHDTAVLRSLITHCKERKQMGISEWPNVIQFETMGNCDKKEGYNVEWKVINTLEKEDYVLVHYSNYNSHLAYRAAQYHNPFVKDWAETFCCKRCNSYHKYPYVTNCAITVHCETCSRI